MLADFLTAHDVRLFALALLTSLIGCHLGFALLPHGVRRNPIAIVRTSLAATVLGATAWLAFHCSLAAFFPYLHAMIAWQPTALGVLLTVTGSGAMFGILTFTEYGARNTLLAASLLASANSCMVFIGMASLAAPMTLAYNLIDVLLAMVGSTAVCAFGLRYAKQTGTRTAVAGAATLVALAVPSLHIASLAAILPFSDWESMNKTPDALSLRPLTVVFGSELIVILLLARAGAAVDRQAALRAAQENARLRQLTEIAFEGILVHRAGRILDANRAFCAMVGCDLYAVTARDLSEFAPAYRYRRDGPPLEIELRTANAVAVPVEMLSRSITLSDGEAEVTAVRDIRERRAAEQSARDRQRVLDLQREAEEQRERRRIAEEASRAKSAFLAMMSHEIRTPLNAVLGLAASLLDDALSTEQYEVVTAIRDSGDLLLRILNDVLDFSKLDAGRMSFEAAPFSPATLTQETQSMHGPQAVAKQLDMRVEIDPALPGVLLGDAGRIGQVLHNLVSNAVKFTDSGKIVVAVRCLERTNDTAKVEWVVSDSGIGIAQSHLATLFDAFVQADSSITRRFGGSGLGLAISKQIVGQMGGSIAVESQPGKGSRFRVCLTLKLGQQVTPQQADVRQTAEKLRQVLEGLGRPLRLLLAEDNPTNRFVVVRMLKDFPIEVELANDGKEAVRAAAAARFDVICMDMRMPEMDGLEATRAIRRQPGPSRDTPVVAMTANAFPEDVEACRKAGMTDFVAKPVGKNRQVEAILRALPEEVAAAEG